MKNPFLPSAIAAAVLILVNQSAQAQTAEAPAAEPSKEVSKEIQQVVVTGVASARGVRKVDSAFSITTANEEQLKQAAPSSTADIMKLVPGVYAESTGGQSGANIEVRGFPSGSDSPFVSVQMMGNPIFPPPTLSFFEGSSAFRLDDTVERVEILRDGASSIYGSDAIGGVVQIFTKKGEGAAQPYVGMGIGSLRSTHLEAAISGADGAIDYALGVQNETSLGFNARPISTQNPDRDGYRSNSGYARVGAQFNRDQRLEATLPGQQHELGL